MIKQTKNLTKHEKESETGEFITHSVITQKQSSIVCDMHRETPLQLH